MKNIESIRPNPGAAIITLLNLTTIGLLAGLSFCVQFGLVPVLKHLDAAAYLTTTRDLIPPFTNSVRPLMVIGLVTFLARLFWHKPECRGARYWIAVSFAFFIAGAAITIAGHFPINEQLMKWPSQNPTTALEAMREKWLHLNNWRFAVAQLALVTALIPVAFGRRRQPGTIETSQMVKKLSLGAAS